MSFNNLKIVLEFFLKNDLIPCELFSKSNIDGLFCIFSHYNHNTAMVFDITRIVVYDKLTVSYLHNTEELINWLDNNVKLFQRF